MKAKVKLFRFMVLRLYPFLPITSKDTFILHYPACGFKQFWARYMAWGNFKDTAWGGKRFLVDMFGPFHLESRDVVMQGDRNLAREFHEGRYVMSDQKEIRQLFDADLIRRIESVAILLSKIESEEGRYQFTT